VINQLSTATGRAELRAIVAANAQRIALIVVAFVALLLGCYAAHVPAQLVAVAVGVAVVSLVALHAQERTGRRIMPYIAPVIAAMMLAAVQAMTYAQSVTIDFSAADLDTFFEWFNMIFTALLPIALLGAGLTAGGLFVWVIAGMLIRAFQAMLGRGMSRA
jgi:hypothetical protein